MAGYSTAVVDVNVWLLAFPDEDGNAIDVVACASPTEVRQVLQERANLMTSSFDAKEIHDLPHLVTVFTNCIQTCVMEQATLQVPVPGPRIEVSQCWSR